MNKNNYDDRKTYRFLSKGCYIIDRYATTFLISLMIFPSLYSQNYYVSPTATGSGDGSIGNPWTIYQAAANAQAGDTVFVDKGTYPLVAQLSFNNSGTASNPIVFRGVRADGDERYLSGSTCTVLRQDNSSSNDQIVLRGNYITLKNMVMLQQYPKWLVVLSGNYCILDSVVTQYPSNVGSGSNHTVRILGDYATLRHSYFWRSPRTVIWVRTNGSGQHCTGFLMEYCTVADYSGHYAIQCMPSPGIGGDPTTYFLEAGTIRNNIFMESGYESAIYLRNVHNYKIYNNLFIKGGGYYGVINFEATDQVVSSPAYDAESIFANNTIWDDRPTTGAYNSGTNELVLHGFSNMAGWHFMNNVFQGHSATYLYRYMTGRASSGTPATGSLVDYNLYYLTNEAVESNTNVWASTSYNWNSWTNTLGFDNNSIINTNPNFVNPTTNPATWDFHLGTQRTGEDLSSWGITTDYNGNPRDPNNPTIGAFEYVNGGVDVTPPNLVGAVLNNATSLRLNFSEQLNSSAAQNISNYSINNGISVTGATVSGSQVSLTTSAHISGNYVVTVNNVTDLAGNIINPNQNTAAYNYTPGDVTPPNLLGALLNNPTSLTLDFSEQLNSSAAQNINNYTINNGISVTAASVNGLQVTLTTTAHTSGNYIVTVNNVTDLAGNLINPSNNSAAYNYSIVDVTPPQVVSAAIIDSVKLNVYFSENLDPNTSQNINNYNIAGINITGAILNSNIVTLSTSVHSNGTYTVIVSNVEDIAGNIIDPQQNSAIYEYVPSVPGQMKLPVSGVLESVVPEPQHNGEKTIDGKGYYQGDPESRWAGDTMPEWLVYDLGDVQIINKTKLSFYNWNNGRIYNYSIQASSDSIQWSNVRTNIPSVLEEWSIEEIGPIEARYIKIIFVANNQNAWAGLWESEFWGHLKVPTIIEDEEIAPTSFILEQNYPNPFNPSTKIRFSLPTASNVRLLIYNTLGELIMTPADGNYEAGTYDIEFSAAGLASGIYYYRIEAGNFAETKKMIVMK